MYLVLVSEVVVVCVEGKVWFCKVGLLNIFIMSMFLSLYLKIVWWQAWNNVPALVTSSYWHRRSHVELAELFLTHLTF